jgi:hypothetical protein
MTRILVFIVALGALASCAQYREPRANCFSLVTRGPALHDCDFEPFGGGPESMDQAHE